MKKICWIIIILIITGYTKLFSQDSLIENYTPKHVIQLSCLDLLISNISLNYSYFISKRHSIDIMIGYRFGTKNSDIEIGSHGNLFHDPFWLYNMISVKLGIRSYFPEDFYIEPKMVFKYGFFNKEYFKGYNMTATDAGDMDYVFSRDKKIIGGIVNLGYTHSYKRFRFDFYMGLGYGGAFKTQAIYEKIINYGNYLVPDNYPINSHTFKNLLMGDMGILVGFGFK